MSRKQKCCNRGHEFTPENTYVYSKTGARHCKTCRAEYEKNKKVRNPELYGSEEYKSRMREHRRKWIEKNPEYYRMKQLELYGIDITTYNDMLAKQENKCAICTEEMNKANVDHNHTTGRVRDLLCTNCNMGIGSLRENPVIMLAAIEYLQRHNQET